MSACIRDDAVSTVVVTPILYLEQRACAAGRYTSGQYLITASGTAELVQIVRESSLYGFFAQCDDFRARGCTADEVNFSAGLKFVRLGLRKTAAGGNDCMRIFPTNLMKCAQVFVIADGGDTASIDDESIGIARADFMSARLCLLHQCLRFEQVHFTA